MGRTKTSNSTSLSARSQTRNRIHGHIAQNWPVSHCGALTWNNMIRHLDQANRGPATSQRQEKPANPNNTHFIKVPFLTELH